MSTYSPVTLNVRNPFDFPPYNFGCEEEPFNHHPVKCFHFEPECEPSLSPVNLNILNPFVRRTFVRRPIVESEEEIEEEELVLVMGSSVELQNSFVKGKDKVHKKTSKRPSMNRVRHIFVSIFKRVIQK